MEDGSSHLRNEQPTRSVPTGRREPQAGDASCLSHSASKEPDASGEAFNTAEPKTTPTGMVRSSRACRGLRAWRALKETHGTKEARRVPAALTARAKQEGQRNDKECCLAIRESDRFIVGHCKASHRPEASEGADSLTKHAQATSAARLAESRWPTFLRAKTTCQVEEPGAGKLPAGICEGGTGRPVSLPRQGWLKELTRQQVVMSWYLR